MKHPDIISRLTLEEKCYLLSGKNFWQSRDIPAKGVPGMTLSDGPHGIRRQAGEGDPLAQGSSLPATCFPTASAVANSWDIALGEEIGRCLGEEAAAQGVNVLLGPGLNIKRTPLCGRNFEYFSEDPYLAGKMAAGYIRGIQENGVAACPKHFAANNTELRRQASDSVVDERTLREIYLTGFEIAVKEGRPKALMSAYNMVNGVYANENAHLLQEILRDQWGFDGFVVSDWGGSNDHAAGVAAGSHLEMPTTGGDSDEELIRAVKDGRLSEDLLDRRVDELLDVALSACAAAAELTAGKGFDADAHHALAERAAEQSIVLLKNENGILPLKKGSRVAVIGEFARTPRYQGAGSSLVNCTRLDSALGVIGSFDLDMAGFEAGYPLRGPDDPALRSRAAELAKKADYVLLYIGLNEVSESEGLDRPHMELPRSQIDLLEAVAAVNHNVIAVLAAGAAVEMPWLDQCAALVHSGLCGQAGARAVLKVITGQVNPSGKLSESYPLKYGDTPSAPYYPARERTVEYREGLYVGYRYFETAGVPVRFPFGFGLSYTTFAYSDLKVTDKEAVFTLKNTGETDGAEVAQLYVHAKAPAVYRPARELKGFAKVFLRSGESRSVTIPLDDKAFRYFNVKTDRFEIDGGEYEILIGASSADIRLAGTVTVAGTDAPAPCDMSRLPSYAGGDVRAVPDAEFEALLGRPIPGGGWGGSLRLNDAICQMSYAKGRAARLICRVLTRKLEKSVEKGNPSLSIHFIYNMPFRAMGKITGGLVSIAMCESAVDAANGRFFRGLGGMISGFFRQRRVRRRTESLFGPSQP